MSRAARLDGPVFVTGAGGFVGSHVLAALAAAYPGAEIIRADVDIVDADAVRRAIAAARPRYCLHLAAVAAIAEARAEPDRAWAVNLGGTLNLARAILAEAPSCRMVFASSADIYGASFRSGLPLDETALPAPLNTYAATKAAADLALGALAAEAGLLVVRLRAFNHTGAGQTDAFVVPAFARQIARIEAGLAEPVIKVGALDTERDFLDVRDVARAYVAALARGDELPAGAVFNIAAGRPRRIGEMLEELLAISGVTARIEPDPARMRPSDIPRTHGDARRAAELLGWRAVIPWTETLGTVLEDWRARVPADRQ